MSIFDKSNYIQSDIVGGKKGEKKHHKGMESATFARLFKIWQDG